MKNYRYSFDASKEVIELPNLISLQKTSYADFLQMDIPRDKRKPIGLHNIFLEVFPVKDLSGKAQLEYHGYYFEPIKFSEKECRYKGLTYSASLKLVLRLIVWEFDQETGSKSIKDIKEQDVYMGEIPIMTDRATFIINGVERVIVSQMHRSPGVFFDHDSGRSHVSGKYLFAARIVPYRGSWFDFEFDYKDFIHVRIDRRRKISLATFLFSIPRYASEELESKEAIKTYSHNGYTISELLTKFYDVLPVKKVKNKWKIKFESMLLKRFKPKEDIINAETNEVIFEANAKITPRILAKLKKDNIRDILVGDDFLLDKYLTCDFINPETGEILLETGTQINEEVFGFLKENNIKEFSIFNIDSFHVGAYIIKTLFVDKVSNREEALIDLVRVLRPGEPPTLETGELVYKTLYSDPDRYDLSAVGRVKLNMRLGLDVDDSVRILRPDDIFAIIKKLIEIKDGLDDVDDIDNLGNRRVRAVGELIENQYRMGIMRIDKSIRERIAASDIDLLMPHDLINAKTLASLLREFFGTSQLSQFMDQTNPLSEVAHKRRLSALGPGGLSRDHRVVFEVRDVHPTHFGRICPIETPEGPNIGLINSLASYARINKYGFIETPYRKVVDSKVTNDVVYMTSTIEANCVVAHSNVKVDEDGRIIDKFVVCSKNTDYITYPREEVEYIDVSPRQLISVAASLIPFLENDDANRALMGSNMQRQAVPLVRAQAPIIGTGMEQIVARDSGAIIMAKRAGYVEQVDSKRVVVRAVDDNNEVVGVDIYNLRKFERSNMGTCVNQKPVVSAGEFVENNQLLADGPATDKGELALGQNVRVAFMSWNGYNFEDSIVISERISQDDIFTSIHIDELETVSRDTKLGCEEITRDIPNVSDEFLRHLDESGIVHIGANVKPGDILVGKVTPKGELILSPEEKLLRAIFGEKASDVKDSSLRVSAGVTGTVVDVRVFSRRGVTKDERTLLIERQEIEKAKNDCDDGIKVFEHSYSKSILEIFEGQAVKSAPLPLRAGDVLDKKSLEKLPVHRWKDIIIADDNLQARANLLSEHFEEGIKAFKDQFNDRLKKISQGEELSPGVLKVVKVFIAVKRKLQPGDKMAGRHGNKGVVSKVVPVEDMPFTEDGHPIDLIVNPLGVPSRMNVGQILETHLGAAAVGIGKKVQGFLDIFHKNNKDKDAVKNMRAVLANVYPKEELDKESDDDLIKRAEAVKDGVPLASPVFHGPPEAEVDRLLAVAGLDNTGQVDLYDGQTGLKFDRKVTVGQMYMLKLHHLVDDKMHARSIGPYSLVTQQPLGGKAQLGGQRFGEMEVWALEAYGAAYTLREMLTIKSDDVIGRMDAYDKIIRNESGIESNEPESFRVLKMELKSLGLEVQELKRDEYETQLKKQAMLEV